MENLKICTIGGGSGMPIVNSSLVRAGFKNIYSIVTTFDSGGHSGRMRTDERGAIMAFSDYWRSLISLWKDGKQKKIWEEMLRFRDGRDRNFGNMFFQFLSEKAQNPSEIDTLFSRLTGAMLNGQVIPVSLEPSNMCFSTKSGKEYVGEHMLDELRMSKDEVDKVWLCPKVKANPEVLRVLTSADVIIVCPGSMHGSAIVNLLPEGVKEALINNSGKKILMTNIMSMSNENNGYDQQRYVQKFREYFGEEICFDTVVMADLTKLDKKVLAKVLGFYEMENSFPIAYKKDCPSINTLVADVAIVEPNNMRLRHSETKLAKFLKNLLE